jgi:hypothetical protein
MKCVQHFFCRAVFSRLAVWPCAATTIVLMAVLAWSDPAAADEDGISFWLPGTFGSLAAVPTAPGFSFVSSYYHTSVTAGANVTAAREITIGQFTPSVTANLAASLRATGDLVFLTPAYTFATPVLGGQAAVSMTGVFGRTSTSINGTLTATAGPITVTRPVSLSDELTSVGDLYPMATLKWMQGVNNFMIYTRGDIPVGAYDANRLSNIGIGHGAIDAGAGYTYFDPTKGHELSAVAGFTYNFKNPTTDYQSGADFHLDWAASQFLSKQFHVGLVGYLYDQVGCDSGGRDLLGCFRSRVAAAGPQVGYLFPVGEMQGYLNLKGYYEFAADNRPQGWNVWLTFAISPPTPGTPPPRAPMVYK